MVKSPGLTGSVLLILSFLSSEEESGIPGVAVKCVDIRKNTSSEGGFSGPILTLRCESVGSKQD